MFRTCLGWAVCAFLWLLLSFASSAAQDSAIDERIADLIRKLGDGDFKIRQAASNELSKIGEPCRTPLERVIRENPNSEIGRRARDVLATLNQQRLHAGPLEKLTFRAVHFTPLGKYPHQMATSYGEFTVRGPKGETLKPLPNRIAHVAYDPVKKQHYGLASHEVYQIDLDKNTATMMVMDKDVPKLSWPCGIAFDTKRQRLIVVSLGGKGDMYAYSPAAGKWSHITDMNNIDLSGLTYDAKEDCLYGLQRPYDRGHVELLRFNENGAVLKVIRMPAEDFPDELGKPVSGPPVSLAAVDGLVAIVTQASVFLVDPSTGTIVHPRKNSEAARNSNVHVVGLYEANGQHFRLIAPWGRDFQWPKFCATLVEEGGKQNLTPAKRIWELLPQAVRNIVSTRETVERIAATVQNLGGGRPDMDAMRDMNRVCSDLEALLKRNDFYDAKYFANLKLDEEGERLRDKGDKRTPLENLVFNRRLLEASFPGVQRNGFTLDKATVPVRVAATKEPIVLVLCSYESVRWLIQPDKGAKIEKVIVGGYHFSEATGVDVPIIYRIYERPDPMVQEPRYFYAYKQGDDSYVRMVNAVRKLTGQEIASFQGRYGYQGGPAFVVGAGR